LFIGRSKKYYLTAHISVSYRYFRDLSRFDQAMKYSCLFCQYEVASGDSKPIAEHLQKEHEVLATSEDLEKYCLVIDFVEEDSKG